MRRFPQSKAKADEKEGEVKGIHRKEGLPLTILLAHFRRRGEEK